MWIPRAVAVFVILVVAASDVAFGQVVVAPPPDNSLVRDALRRRDEAAERERQREHDERMLKLEAELRAREREAAARAAEPSPATLPSGAVPTFERTNGGLNGRAWRSWVDQMRAMYLLGFYEAASGVREAEGDLFSRINTSASLDELIAGITAVYEDAAMRPVPIALVVPVFVAQARGATPSEVAEMKAAAIKASVARSQ